MQRWGLLAGGAAVCWTCGFTTALRFLGSNDVEPHQSEQHDHGQQGDGCGSTSGSTSGSGAGVGDTAVPVVPQPVLPCLRARRSVFPRDFAPDGSSVGRDVVQSLLAAAAWAPFHGPVPPWRFVVLGHHAMREMQRLTLAFYDRSWQATGWACGTRGSSEQYQRWRAMTEEEIEGRWGGCS
eukprot:COSAG06_NODE_24184_length_670_cov_0.982487_1_plen_180_part_01